MKTTHYAGFIFGVLLVVYAYFFPRWAEWNQNSRFDLVLAVVDQGTLAIDAYRQNTGDYAVYKGHYYSDKAPGTAFLGIPVYWGFRTFLAPLLTNTIVPRLATNPAFAATLNPEGTGLLENKIYFFMALTFVTFFVVAIPSAGLGVLFYRLAENFSGNRFNALALTFAFALATPAFAYSNLFYGHQIVAFCLFAAFYLLFHDRSNSRALSLIAIGFLCGWALITEYPSVLIVAGIGLYALYRVRDWRKWIWLGLGGLPPLVLAALYNWTIFGTPLPVGYEYSELWQDVHQQGFFSITAPSVEAIWGITFSPYRGLFYLAPFLLLSIPGFFFFWRAKSYRAEFWVALWSVTIFFLFNGSSVMWTGGFSVGPRYLVPMLPFLALPIIFVFEAIRNRWLAIVVGLLAVVSWAIVWIETIGGQSFPQNQATPLLDYSLPRLLAGDIARNVGMILGLRGWMSLLPLVLLACGMVFIGLWWLPRPISFAFTARGQNLNAD